MPRTKDPIGRNKQIGAIRKRMADQLNVYAVFGDLSPQQMTMLEAREEYGNFKRVESERELEAIKKQLASYIFDPNVVIQGTVQDKDRQPRVVEMSKFDAALKATKLYLETIHLQNRMWNVYALPEKPPSEQPPPPVAAPTANLNIKSMSVAIVQELQKIAKKELPVIVDNEIKRIEDAR
jgi:hypothetical protein